MTVIRQEIENTVTELQRQLKIKGRAERTVNDYAKHVRNFLQWDKLKIKKPKNIRQKDIDDYIIHLREHYSVNSLVPIVAAIKFLVNDERMLNKGLIFPSTPVEETEITPNMILEPEQMKRMITDAPQKMKELNQQLRNIDYEHIYSRDRALLATLNFGETRRTETVLLNIEDIDFKQKRILLRHRKRKKKRREPPSVALHPENEQAILEYLKETNRTPNDTGPLFLNRFGERLSPKSVWDRVKVYAKLLRIPKRTYPHLFRHSNISYRANAGMSDLQLAEQSGHADINMVKRYRHTSNSAQLNNVIRSNPSMIEQEKPDNKIDKLAKELNATELEQLIRKFQEYRKSNHDPAYL